METEREPDTIVDPRIRQLLEQWAALSGAAIRQVDADRVEVDVPPPDRASFAGRATVRVAFSLDALAADPDAEIAVIGSAFVDQLIAAVRARGARLYAGDVRATVPASAESAGLGIPVSNGSAGVPSAMAARHPVGRLVARVTIRAGAEVEEHLVESGVFDLATGAALADDVAAACGSGEREPANGAHPAGAVESSPRLASRPVAELIPLMLGDLERRLAPELARLHATSERALAEELQRIDGYYGRLLSDPGGHGSEVPDEDGRRAIEAEHQRRRAEEIRRHEVRATVHPVQLVEWGLPVQRAEWPLASADGHKASLVGERALVGAGGWTIGCPHCGRAHPESLVVCAHDHAACSACSARCAVCDTGFCADHGIAACHVDGHPTCDTHARTCASCRRVHCSAHEGTCAAGGHAACSACLAACVICGTVVCELHATQSAPGAPRGVRRLCATCVRHCEGGTNEPVGADEVVRCASCERYVCTNHQATCAVDGQVHCSTHLRRADRSRRLVCAHDRATCAHEPNAIFARDEVAACATCGKMSCDEHAGPCGADGTRHCRAHLVAWTDRPGVAGCAAHHSVCHVDGVTFSPEGTKECPACGRLACASHTRKCPSCARPVCAGELGRMDRACKTCRSLAETADPADALVQAAVAAQKGQAVAGRRWRTARDASHTVVEIDLGWTRKVVFTVRHGDSVPETVVRSSVLGGVVEKG